MERSCMKREKKIVFKPEKEGWGGKALHIDDMISISRLDFFSSQKGEKYDLLPLKTCRGY